MKNTTKQFDIGNLLRKIDTQDMQLITTVIYIANVVMFELLYCNYEYILKIIPQYNFSIYRIIVYISLYCFFYRFKDHFIEPAIEAFQSKWKCLAVEITIFLLCILWINGLVVMLARKFLSVNLVILLIATLNFILLVIYMSNSMLKNAVVTALLIGSVFSISITFNNQLDEKRHFLSAYSISMGNLNLKHASIDESVAEMPRNLTVRGFIGYYKQYPSDSFSKDMSNRDIKDIPNDYITISYLVSGLGVFLAKILGGSIADIYLTGRIFNLLGYIFIMVCAIKTMPYKKHILYAIFFMPMILALSSVYSVDGIGTATTALFVAYCLKLHEKKEINIKQLIALISLLILAATIKSVGYIGISLLVLILPLKKIYKQNKRYIKYIAIFFAVILVIVAVIYIMRINEPGDPRTKGTDTLMQFKFIINNPMAYAKILTTHIVQIFTNLKGLSFLNAPMFFRRTYYYGFLALLEYLLFISITDGSKQLKARTRIIFIITFLIVIAMTSTAMYLSYTKVGAEYIEGFQMRYMFPILILLLSSISIKRLELDNKFKYFELILSYIPTIFLVISTIDLII